MADKPRFGKPYVWVTWITGLLAGTNKCEWAPWYKARYRFEKRENDDFDANEWKAEHSRMVLDRAESLLANGYSVSIEDDNAFQLKGTAAILAGKPDVVAITDGTAPVLVIDQKSGDYRKSYEWQVRVYQFALPRTLLKGRRIVGEVEYKRYSVAVEELTPEQEARIVSVMQMIGNDIEPPHTPSIGECQFCDIANCPKRAEPKPESIGTTKDF